MQMSPQSFLRVGCTFLSLSMITSHEDKFHFIICIPQVSPNCTFLCENLLIHLQGIPPSYRGWVWEQVSGAAKLQSEHMNNYYEAMVHQGQATSPSAHQIELVNLQSQLAVLRNNFGCICCTVCICDVVSGESCKASLLANAEEPTFFIIS